MLLVFIVFSIILSGSPFHRLAGPIWFSSLIPIVPPDTWVATSSRERERTGTEQIWTRRTRRTDEHEHEQVTGQVSSQSWRIYTFRRVRFLFLDGSFLHRLDMYPLLLYYHILISRLIPVLLFISFCSYCPVLVLYHFFTSSSYTAPVIFPSYRYLYLGRPENLLHHIFDLHFLWTSLKNHWIWTWEADAESKSMCKMLVGENPQRRRAIQMTI